MTYGKEKDRATVKPAAGGFKLPARPAPELTPEQVATVAANREFIKTHMPEVEADLRIFFEDGWCQGWRAIDNCQLINSAAENDNGGQK